MGCIEDTGYKEKKGCKLYCSAGVFQREKNRIK